MTPVMQKPNGCYAACLASITGIPLDEFPHPSADEAFTQESWSTYRNGIVRFMKARGWFIVYLWMNAPEGFSIVSGTSPRNIGHSCVALDGEIVHDPHPDGGRLVSVDEYEVLLRIVKGRVP